MIWIWQNFATDGQEFKDISRNPRKLKSELVLLDVERGLGTVKLNPESCIVWTPKNRQMHEDFNLGPFMTYNNIIIDTDL